jgi:Spy/CpxP family protein refolding chaperone
MFGFGGFGGRGGGTGGPGGPWARRMHGMRGKGCGPWAMLSDLDLSDDQMEKFAELKIEGMGKFAQFKSKMAGLMHQIGKELTNESIDRDKVKEIAKEIKTYKTEFGDAMLDRAISCAEILTVAQRKKLRMNLLRRFVGVGSASHEEE